MSLVADRTEVSPEKLPKQIVDILQRAIRRRRNILLLRGFLGMTAVGLGLLLGLMAVDIIFTIVSDHVRWVLSLGSLAIFLGATVIFLMIPLSRRMTLIRMAQFVDAHHPEFEERVSSTVELLSAKQGRYSEVSPQLLEALTMQAVQQVRAVQPRKEFNLHSIRTFVGAAAGAALVWAAVWLAWPGESRHLMSRIINPSQGGGNLRSADLLIDPGSKTVGAGEPLTIRATLRRGGVQQAKLLRQEGGSAEVALAMVPVPAVHGEGSTFALTLPRVTGPFQYRVLVGGALSRHFDIRVTPPPAVKQLDVQYEYPSYTGLAPRTMVKAKGDIVAPVGTQVSLTAHCNKSLGSAELTLGGKVMAPTRLTPDGDGCQATWAFVLEPGHSGPWSLTLRDAYSIESRTPPHKVEIIPDAAPVIGIVEPQDAETRLRPDDRLPILYRVREDYGIAKVSLLVRSGSAKELSIATSLPQRSTLEEKTWVGRATLDLGSLQLPNVPRIEVLLDVQDTLPESLGGPQHALSQPIVIVLDGNAQNYSAQSAEKSIRKLQSVLGDALNQLKGAKGQIASVRPTLDKQPLRLTPEGARAIDTARNHSAEAEKLLNKASEETTETELADYARQAGEIASEHVTPARQALELIPLAHVKQEQVDQAKSTEEHVDAAIAALEALIESVGEEQQRLAQARELAGKLGDLADDQARLRQSTQKAEDPTEANSADDIAERIRDAQWKIAQDATMLARKIDQSGYNAGAEHREASDFARQAANRLIDKKQDEARPLGQQAADKFDKAAERLAATPPPQQPQDPLDPPFAEATKQLAERQKRVNEQLDALKKGDLAKALESLQKDVAERAKQLAERTKKLADTANVPQAGNPQGKKDVKMPYKDTVGQAVEKAEMAAANLGHINNVPKVSPPKFVEGPQSPSDSGGSPDGGQGTKGGGSNTGAGSSKGPSPSNNNINNTIAKGKNLGKATLTAEALMNQKPGSHQGPSGGSGTELQKDAEELLRKGLAQILADNNPLAKGFGGFGGSAPDVPVPPTEPKEFSAVGAEQQPGGEPQGEGSGEPGQARESGKGAKLSAGPGRVAHRLSQLGISGSDWLKLPSDLRTEILSSNDDRAPREYRELVRRYFQTMARRAAESK